MEMPFPVQGIDLERTLMRQRQGTTVEAVNVLSFQDSTLRDYGSTRSGFKKYLPSVVNAANVPIQNINSLISTILAPANTSVNFTYGQATNSGFGLADKTSGSSISSGLGAVSGFAMSVSCWGDDGEVYVAETNVTTGAVNIYRISSAGTVDWTQSGLTVATGSLRYLAGMVMIGNFLFVAQITSTTYTGGACRIARLNKSTGLVQDATWRVSNGSTFPLFFSQNAVNCLGKCGTVLGVDVYAASNGQGFNTFDSNSAATTAAGNLGGVAYGGTANHSNTHVVSDGINAFYVIASVATSQIKKIGLNNQVMWSSTAADTANSLTFNASDGSLIALCNTAPSIRKLSLTDGSQQSTPAQGATIYNEIDCDGQGAYVVWKNGAASNDVQGLGSSLGSAWGPSSLANATHSGASVNKGRTVTPTNSDTNPKGIRLLAVSGGLTYRIDKNSYGIYVPVAPTGGVVSMNVKAPQLFSSQLGLNMFYVDGVGYYYYRNSDDKFLAWAATNGTLPVDSPVPSGARCIETWNGRLVIFGFVQQRQLYAMSAQGDAFNWNPSPATTTTTQAVSGSVDGFGFPGEVLNAFVPYTDDTAIIGADHKLWILRGDPMNGGRFDVVSHSIGMPFGRPWAIDSLGQIYFLSSQGDIYKLVPGAQPMMMSGKISKLLQDVNLALMAVSMAWDVNKRRLYVWITPTAGGKATHYIWCEKTDSWTQMEYANKYHNPLSVHVFDGDQPDDRRILLGGQDGYLRIMKDGADDDGYDIASSVLLGPFLTPNVDNVLIETAQPTFTEESEEVQWEWLTGKTPQLALAGPPVMRGTWRGGRSTVTPIHRSGFVSYLRMKATGQYAFEKLMVKMRTLPGRIYA